jgi:hypothetical protein
VPARTAAPRRSPVWVVHAVAWIGLAATLLPVVTDVVADASAPWRTAALVAFWALWAAGVVAIAVPRPWGLVVLRLGGMLMLEAAVMSAAAGAVAGVRAASAVAVAAGACMLACAAEVGDRMIDGSSYPGERRFAMRMPGDAVVGVVVAVALPAVALATVVAVAVTDGAVRVVAVVVAVLCTLGTALTFRSLVLLAKRWLVLAPRAVAVVDPHLLADAMMIPLQRIVDVSTATPDVSSDALLDVRAGRGGVWVQLLTDELCDAPAARPLPARLAGLRPPVPAQVIGVALPLSLPAHAVAVLAATGLPTGTELFEA